MFKYYKQALDSRSSTFEALRRVLVDSAFLAEAEMTIIGGITGTGYNYTLTATTGEEFDFDFNSTTSQNPVEFNGIDVPAPGVNLIVFAENGFFCICIISVQFNFVTYRSFVPLFDTNSGIKTQVIELNELTERINDGAPTDEGLYLTAGDVESDIVGAFTNFAMFPLSYVYTPVVLNTHNEFLLPQTDHVLYTKENEDNTSKHKVVIDTKSYTRVPSKYSDIFYYLRTD